MWLIKASLRNPFMVLAFVLMIVFMGIVSLRNIPVDILPVFKAPAVEVLTYFQGMPAASIEKTITNRIERWVNQAPGAEVVESKSVPGVSVVKTYFRDDVDPNSALTVTNSLALGTLPTLPPNTLPPVVLPFDPTGTMPLCILTVESPRMDEAHVKDVARVDVRNMLGAVKGCVAPVVIGGKDRTVLIYLDPERLEARHLSPLDVVNALQKGNIMVTPGTAYFGKTQVLLDTNVMVDRIDELNNFPVVTERGHAVYLRDVGEARDSYAIQTSRVRISSAGSKWVPHRQVYVPVYRQQGASTVAVVEGVRKAIPRMTEELRARYDDPDLKLDLVMDQSVYVHEAIHSLIEEGIIGACLVSVMILVFLGNWRMTVIASLSIPLAILGAVSCLYATGNTINAMTLGGLALAIGPLVDDAIVALENTHRHMHMGKSSLRAAYDGSVEVMVPVLVATCTTSIVLSPLALMPGMGGFLFRPLALAVAFAMFSSFLLSRTFVPMMCAKFLPDVPRRGHGPAHAGHEHHGGGGLGRAWRRIEQALEGLTRAYERLLGWALRHRAAVLATVGLLFVGSLGLTFGIGQEFFPQVDAGQLTVYLRSPSYMRLDASEQRVAEVEKFVKGLIPADEREMIVAEMGLDPDWSSAYSDNSGQQDTVLRVQLSEKRRHSAQEYAVELRHRFHADPRFHDLRVSCNTGGMVSTALNYGAASPIDVQVAGGKLEDAFALAKKVRDGVAGVRGAADVRILQRLDAPYLVIQVDRQKAGDMGLSAYDVIEQAVAAMNSSVSIKHNFWIDTKTGNQYFVGVQFPENPKMTLGEVRNIDITGPNQPSPVKLSQVADIKPSSGAVEINHVSLYRVFNVQVNTEDRDVAGVAKDVIGRLRGLQAAEWARAAAKPPGPQPIQARLPGAQAVHVALAQPEAAPNGRPPQDGERGEMAFPGGMRVELRGEYGRMNDSFSKLVFGLAAASVLVYLLQVALFRSWVGPFIIMFTVPLGLIGVLTMLFVTRTTLNVQSEMGVIFLVGIAVNNGVLLVEFANNQRRLGADAHKAITTAAAIRFRPILMTFLATFLDLIPMAIGLGKGSEANVPLARAVVGGLLTSTCLTLFVVPILYTLLMKKGRDETDIEAELAGEPPAGPAPIPALAGAAVGGGGMSQVPAEALHPHVLEGPVRGGFSPAPPEPWPEGPTPREAPPFDDPGGGPPRPGGLPPPA
jgi:multidrug efflux pump subunit AcrB